MRTITTEVYSFKELSDSAKERAREWWRESSSGDEWWDYIYEDAERARIKITAFDLGRGNSIEGRFLDNPTDTANKIIEDHGETCDTHKTAAAFLKERDSIVDSWPKDENVSDLDDKLDAMEAEFLHAILEDYLVMLNKEYEYYYSDEHVDECIEINEYEFYENGEIA